MPGSSDALPPSLLEGTGAMPEVVDHVAVAKLYGEPLFALPQDLYIPPDALQVFWKRSRGHWTCCCT